MPKSRADFVQKPYFKKSHKAMYVDIDGRPRRLCKGDTLTEGGRAAYPAALQEKGSEPEREYVESRNLRELVDEFLQSLQADVKKGKFAPRTYDWYSRTSTASPDRSPRSLLLTPPRQPTR